MKALSLWQPYASCIALGRKSIETRSYPTSYRGLLAIHAAKHWTDEERELEGVWPFGDVLDSVFWTNPPLGCVVAIVEFFACYRMTPAVIERAEERLVIAEHANRPSEYHFGLYEEGRFMWMLRDVQKIDPPIPARGMQGLWEWDAPTDVRVS